MNIRSIFRAKRDSHHIMSTTIPHHILQYAAPTGTAVLNSLGLCVGLYGFLCPGPNAAKLFGILLPPPPSRPTSKRASAAATDHRQTEANARQRAWLRIYGIRNIASGLGQLGLVVFWGLSSTCRDSRLARDTVQKVIAVLLATGTCVGVADGWTLGQFVQEGVEGGEGLCEEAKKLAAEKKFGHMGMMVLVLGLAAAWWFL
jgi:hypothetical protein